MIEIAPPPSRLLFLVIGFIIWSIAFVALYAVNAIGCAFGWEAGLQRTVLIALFAVHVALLGGLVWLTIRYRQTAASSTAKTIAYTGLGLTVAALASTLFVLAPSLFASMCI